MDQPILHTTRLLLRPFALADAPLVQRLAGDAAIADTTINIPHPYLDGLAEEWIGGHAARWAARAFAVYAIVREPDGLVGSMGLHLTPPHQRGELGYWVARAHWGQGIATEAGAALLDFGFSVLGLNRIDATHLTRNPASGRVMAKLGMTCEGIHRQYFLKHGQVEDIARYAILRADWALRRQA